MILVDAEMPKRGCRNCPMNYDFDYCKITHKCVTKEYSDDIIAENEETFPSWCPIKAEIPDNATNGDVVMAMFSNADISLNDSCFEGVVNRYGFDEKWWNAPYKAESEE